jgi:hypothetical protein
MDLVPRKSYPGLVAGRSYSEDQLQRETPAHAERNADRDVFGVGAHHLLASQLGQ